MAPEGLDPLAPILTRCPFPAWVGPENEKTPRGCERSARGSEARCPLPRGVVPRIQWPLRTGAPLPIIIVVASTPEV
ncbi:hypothetical protein EF909_21685 [Streptomyces sp. WAC01280]|nr:hypothetical protein EF909_21685 [Streptomyces sp. WAC01280]